MDFLIGDWTYKAKSYQADGTYVNQHYESQAKYIFSKTGIQDDFAFRNAKGEVIILGTTIRSYNPFKKAWRMLWYSNHLNSMTEMEGRYENGRFIFEGKGKDLQNSYLEKIVFYNITENSYSWKMDRSYDNGKSWIKNFFSYDAVKRVKQ